MRIIIASTVLLVVLGIIVVLVASTRGGGEDGNGGDNGTVTSSASATPGGSDRPTPSGSAGWSPTATLGSGGVTPTGGTAAVTPIPTPVPTVDTVAIDARPAGTPGNTANSVGSTENCVSVAVGGSVSLDIVIRGIPAPAISGEMRTGGIIGTGFFLLYDSVRLKVTKIDDKMILAANPGSNIFPAGEPAPDSDGELEVGSLDIGDGTPESGDGVLIRVTFQALTSGAAAVSVRDGDGYYIDQGNEAIVFEPVAPARIAIGSGC